MKQLPQGFHPMHFLPGGGEKKKEIPIWEFSLLNKPQAVGLLCKSQQPVPRREERVSKLFSGS